MPFTREERQTVERLIARVNKLEEITIASQDILTRLEKSVGALVDATNMSDWTDAKWEEFLRPVLSNLLKTLPVTRHDHKTSRSGGPCFARKGANLVDTVG